MKSFGCMPAVRTPEASRTLTVSCPGILPSPLRDKVGAFHHDRFRGYVSVHSRSGLHPPCLRFAAAVAGHHARLGTRLLARLCRGCHLRQLSSTRCKAQPAQIPACGFPAPGSCQRSNAIEVRGFGGPCTPNPQARSFGYTPYPALSPGRALLLAFPPAGRLPSTISATDLWSALFEASLVLCGRPTPHLSRDGFASSASRRGPAPP